ncbi:hypothetical protein P4O66_005221, partial [Electrophorus voltai]
KKSRPLLAVGIVDSLTRLDLVNVTYLKGNWEKKFEGTATRELPFQLSKFAFSQLELVSMDMAAAFNTHKSDFSLMSPCDDLVLSKVVHKSFVEMNECNSPQLLHAILF